MIAATQWMRILVGCGVRLLTASEWSDAFAARVQAEKFSAGRSEIADFTAQVLHETGMLEHLEEVLHYSAQRLVDVWPHHFPTLAAAQPYANQPEALANKVYGGRMGNIADDDGWRYRGRGIPMITGRDNYLLVAKLTGLALHELPDLLGTPDGALRCGVAWWEQRIADSMLSNVETITRAVQGGTLGLAERALLTSRVAKALDQFDPVVPRGTSA